jgi:2',3'-cyclic-nucleotide 2'-phosphodiesterase (5'-nucleotidase family)
VQDPLTLSCEPRVSGETVLPAALYEGRVVTPDPAVDAAMAPALARVRALQATQLGIVLDTPIPRTGDTESPLGNLFADAQRAGTPGADAAINNNFRGGLRADLPEGPLTLGRLYDAFPFDNRLVQLKLTGAELRRVFADETMRNRRGALAVSGLRVRTACSARGVDVELFRDSGEPIAVDDELVVVATDQLVQGVVFASTGIPMERRMARADAPVMREVVEDWLRGRGGRIDARSVSAPNAPRWQHVDAPGACAQ